MTEIKGMILAAGLGTRLRPMTYDTPKPLIDVGGKKLIEYNIVLFKKCGIEDIIINLHYLGDKIKNYLGDGSRYGINIRYSEEENILGTGGGIRRAASQFTGSDLIVVNSDVISDIDLSKLIDSHLSSGLNVTLAVRKLKSKENYTPMLIEKGRVRKFGEGQYMFTGLQIIRREFIKTLPLSGYSNLVKDGYVPYLNKGEKINAYVHNGFWSDIGTLNRLKEIRDYFLIKN